jgi:hypothetical protein
MHGTYIVHLWHHIVQKVLLIMIQSDFCHIFSNYLIFIADNTCYVCCRMHLILALYGTIKLCYKPEGRGFETQ